MGLVEKIKEAEGSITFDIDIRGDNPNKLKKFGRIILYTEEIQNVILECTKNSALELVKQYNAKKLPYIKSVDIYKPVYVWAT